MNLQNPALYPPQQTYGYGAGMAQTSMPPSYPNDLSQVQFQQAGRFPTTPQRPGQFQQAGQVPPHIYQQFQQQQQQQPPQPQQGFGRPQSQGNGLVQGPQRQSPSSTQGSTTIPRTGAPQINTTSAANMNLGGQTQRPSMNPALMQQAQLQNLAQNNKATVQTPLSPQSLSREKARVSVLLDINAHLLQEVVSLQNQGKAGATVQQSPTSPTTENFNSPIDGKAGPSKEYQECMRRLQANLSYLAASADAKKRPDGKIPPYPAIINPPPHLTDVYDLYKKLAALFPEASQSTTNKAIAYASAHHSNQIGDSQGQGTNTSLLQNQNHA